MNLYEALKQMRELTAREEPFSMSFMSYNPSERKSEGVIEVRHALLRKRSTKNIRGEYVLQYYDVDSHEDRQFYFPLLLSFNSQSITHANR